jgi:hypothetical protein
MDGANSVRLPFVGLFADVIRRRASTIDSEIDITLLCDVPEDSFSHRRATDVAKTYDENVRRHRAYITVWMRTRKQGS